MLSSRRTTSTADGDSREYAYAPLVDQPNTGSPGSPSTEDAVSAAITAIRASTHAAVLSASGSERVARAAAIATVAPLVGVVFLAGVVLQLAASPIRKFELARELVLVLITYARVGPQMYEGKPPRVALRNFLRGLLPANRTELVLACGALLWWCVPLLLPRVPPIAPIAWRVSNCMTVLDDTYGCGAVHSDVFCMRPTTTQPGISVIVSPEIVWLGETTVQVLEQVETGLLVESKRSTTLALYNYTTSGKQLVYFDGDRAFCVQQLLDRVSQLGINAST